MTAPINTKPLTAIIADDEPLLAESLKRQLETEWPELTIQAIAANGLNAIELITQVKPDIAFLDIRMPGASGIEVAESIVEDWPDDSHSSAPPVIVFVTAYDEYAMQAFDLGGFDYVLKPVNSTRLAKTVSRLSRLLVERTSPNIEQLSTKLYDLLHQQGTDITSAGKPDNDSKPYLQVIRAGIGDEVRMIPTEKIILLESADKYVLIHTAELEAVIREPLKNLKQSLDPEKFSQIHRGAIVNMAAVEAAVKEESGKLRLRLTGLDNQPTVSRVYRHLFQAM